MAYRKKTAAAREAEVRERPKKRAKRQEESQLTRIQTAEMVREHVNKKYNGHSEIVLGSELELTYLTKRIPTGILSLDCALGGGVPCAGITQLIGRRNCGKTYLYWRIIAQLQRMLGNRMSVALAMTEMKADVSQARAAGVVMRYSETDIAEFIRAREKMRRENPTVPPVSPEEIADWRRQIGTFYEIHGLSGEDLYQAVLDGIYHNAYHLVALDSIANVMGEQEAESEHLHDKTRGGSAAVNTQFVHKLTQMLMMEAPNETVRDTCFIVVNQVRDDQKNPQADYKNTGGHSLEHAKFVDLYLYPGPFIGEEKNIRDPIKGGTKQVRENWGKEVNWQIKKGKAGIHEGARGIWYYYFAHEKSPPWAQNNVDIYTDAALFGIELGVIQQNAAWYTIPNVEDPRSPLLKVCGLPALVQELYDDDMARLQAGDKNSIMKRLRDLCYVAKSINLTYEWNY